MAKETAINQRFSFSSHDTLGSRKSAMCRSITGLAAYRVQVRPSSRLYARFCVCRVPSLVLREPVYTVTRHSARGAQKPLVFSRSTTTLPVNAISPSFLWDCDRKLPPIQEVRANGMPPTHVAPFITEPIELIEEVYASEAVRLRRGDTPCESKPGRQDRSSNAREERSAPVDGKARRSR